VRRCSQREIAAFGHRPKKKTATAVALGTRTNAADEGRKAGCEKPASTFVAANRQLKEAITFSRKE